MNGLTSEAMQALSEQKGPQSQSAQPGIRFLVIIAAGVLATGSCYVAVNSIGLIYPTPSELLNLGATPTAEERAVAMAAKLGADRGNAMVALGTSGAILGGILALTLGYLRRAGRQTVIGTVAGILLGGGMGCLAGCLSISYNAALNATLEGSTTNAEHQFMLMHGMTWGLIGLGIGVACGFRSVPMQLKSVIASMIVAGVAGSLAGVTFPLIVAIAAPLVDSSLPIPDAGLGRVIWMGLASLFMGMGLSRSS